MNTRTIRRSLLSAGLLVVLAIPFQASAGSPQTANLSVTSNISANCTITTGAVAFGAYDPVVANASSPLTAQGSITTTCTTGASPVITLGQGLHTGGGSSDAAPVRQMQDGSSDNMGYGLYQDNAYAHVWGNTTATAPAIVTGTGLPQTVPVYGRVPAGQNLPSGSYADTVVATVTF